MDRKTIESKNDYSLTNTDGPMVTLENKDGETFEITAADLLELGLRLPELGYGHTYVVVINEVEKARSNG